MLPEAFELNTVTVVFRFVNLNYQESSKQMAKDDDLQEQY